MWDSKDVIKFSVSGCLKDLNKRFHRNYTLMDIAEKVGVSRETLSRLTTNSSFSLCYAVAHCLYEFYPEYNENEWNFDMFMELLAYDDCSFFL